MLYLTLNSLNAIICWVQFPNFSLSYSLSQHLVLPFFSFGPFPFPLSAWLTLVFVLCFIRSPSLFLPLCTSRFVLCLLMWNLVGDVFVGPGLKGFLSDPPQLVALPYFLFCSRFSLSLLLSQCSSVFLYCHFLWDTLKIPPLSSLISAQTH